MRSVSPYLSHPPGGWTDPCSHLPHLPVSLVWPASDSAERELGLPCHCVTASEKAVSLFPKRQPSLSGPWGLAPPAAFLGTMCPGRGCIWETVGLDKLSIGLCPQNWAGDQGHLLAGALNLDMIPSSPACPQQSGSGHLLQAWAARESQTDPQAGGPARVAVWDRPPHAHPAGREQHSPTWRQCGRDWQATRPLQTLPG